jgi:hypothetical protein
MLFLRLSVGKERTLTPRHHLRRSSPIHISLVEHDVRSHMCRPGSQHLLFAVNQIARVERRQFKPMPMRNRVRRASFHAVPAKNAPVVVDVVDLGVAFGAAYAVFGGVVGGLDVDAIRRAVGGAEEAGHAFLESVFVALQDVGPAEAGFYARAAQRTLAIGIIFDRGGLEHLHEGDAHAFGDGGDVFQDRHTPPVYRMRADFETRGTGRRPMAIVCEKEASQTRDYCVAENATLRAARPGPSATKGMSPQDDKL